MPRIAEDLDGQDLRTGEVRLRTALAQLGFPFEPVVDELENGDDEGAKLQVSRDLLLTSAALGATERKEVSLFIQLFQETRTRG